MKRRKLPKSLASLLLAVIMLVGMIGSAVPAQAAGTNSITIHKYKTTDTNWSTSDRTGTEADEDNVPGDATLLNGIKYTATLMQLDSSLTDPDPSDTANYVATSTVLEGVTGSGTNTDGVYVFENLEDGLWKIVETVPAGVTAQASEFYVLLPMTDPTDGETQLTDVHVYPKNYVTLEEPEIVKEVKQDDGTWGDEKNVETGEIVTWRISTTIPANIANAQKYEITDTVDTVRLSIPTDVTKVYYLNASDGTTEESLDPGDYAFAETADGFTVTLTAAGLEKLGKVMDTTDTLFANSADGLLYTEFETTVTADSSADLIDIINEAKLEYTNQFGEELEDADNALVYTGGIIVTKVDGSDNTALDDVEFKLYKLDVDGTTKLYYAGTDTNGAVVWETDETKAEILITAAGGEFSVYGLADGTYYLTEMKTNKGYNLLTSDVDITLTSTKDTVTSTYVEAEKTIANYKGFTLPLTGGSGTLWITIIGLALIGTAGIIVIMNKRKKAGKNVSA